jgi:hypothetical protein
MVHNITEDNYFAMAQLSKTPPISNVIKIYSEVPKLFQVLQEDSAIAIGDLQGCADVKKRSKLGWYVE